MNINLKYPNCRKKKPCKLKKNKETPPNQFTDFPQNCFVLDEFVVFSSIALKHWIISEYLKEYVDLGSTGSCTSLC